MAKKQENSYKSFSHCDSALSHCTSRPLEVSPKYLHPFSGWFLIVTGGMDAMVSGVILVIKRDICIKATVEVHIKQSLKLGVRQSHLNTGHKLLEWMVSKQRSLEYHRTV